MIARIHEHVWIVYGHGDGPRMSGQFSRCECGATQFVGVRDDVQVREVTEP